MSGHSDLSYGQRERPSDPLSGAVLSALPSPDLRFRDYAGSLRCEHCAIYNQDRGNAAIELVSRFEGAGVFDEVMYLRSYEDIGAAIDARRATFVLRIGEDFSRRLERGGGRGCAANPRRTQIEHRADSAW